MWGRPKPVVFDPYARRRRSRGLPRWLVLLLLGGAIGAGGVIYIQERHLAPRLSASESATLNSAYQKAENERQRLAAELDTTTQQLDTAMAEKKTLGEQFATSQQTVTHLREDLGFLVEALPPDPRGCSVSVRAARFLARNGQLTYELVLSRERAGSRPMNGVVQFVVSGEGGGRNSFTSEPIAISMGAHEGLRGDLSLPQGFMPQQATIRVMDRVGGQLLGTRVMYVK